MSDEATPLTAAEIDRIKEFHCGVTITHPCCEEIPRLIADLERARELLKGLMDYHNEREACVHMEGRQFCNEACAYLREAEVE